MIQCDCQDRVGVKIHSQKQFEELKIFFQKQVDLGVYRDIPVTKPFYVWQDANRKIEYFANKWYKCQSCGCLWEFEYPDFPACGELRKFEDGLYPDSN